MRFSARSLDLHTRHAFSIARQAAPPSRPSVWLRLWDDDGNEGWGEAAPSAYYGESEQTVLDAIPLLVQAAELATAGDLLALESAEKALHSSTVGNAAARSAVSAALHDLAGRRLGLPLSRLWGIDPRAAPRSSFTIGLDEPAIMRRKIREASNFPILKIKLGTERDEEILGLIRDEAPDRVLRADANTAWTEKQALEALPMLDGYGVELLEQPLAPGDIDGLRTLRRRSPLPIIADESCVSIADIHRLAGAVDGINIKLAKCGGPREAMKMVHCARAHGMLVMVGCMIESTLGIAAAIHAAALADYVDLDGAALLRDDPFVGPGIESDGQLRFSPLPGLGVEKNPEFPWES